MTRRTLDASPGRDDALVDAALAGDEEAFAVLLDRWEESDPARAEVVRLLAAKRDNEAYDLQYEHAARWAGPGLVETSNDVLFERAVPRMLLVRDAESLARAVDEPGTRTLRAIWVEGRACTESEEAWRTFLGRAPLRHLRELRSVSPAVLEGVDNPLIHLDELELVPGDHRYAPVTRWSEIPVKRVVVNEIVPDDLDALRSLRAAEVTLYRRMDSANDPDRRWLEGWDEAVRRLAIGHRMLSSTRCDLTLVRRDDGGWSVVLCEGASWVAWYRWARDLPLHHTDAVGTCFVGSRITAAEPEQIAFLDALPASDVEIELDFEDVDTWLRRTLEWLVARQWIPRAWLGSWGCLTRTDGRAFDHLTVYGHLIGHQPRQLVETVQRFAPELRALTLAGPFYDETRAACAAWCERHGVSFELDDTPYLNTPMGMRR